jgi:hypothetical protein
MIGDRDRVAALRDRQTKATKVWKNPVNFFGDNLCFS